MDIVIPTRFDRPTLAPLIVECQKVARVVIVHTEPGHAPVAGTVTVRSDARNIQTWWNVGLDECTGPALVLNDDVVADAADLAAMFAELESCDLVYVTGRTGDKPMSGWCFGLHPDRIRPDEAFVWWYGDDDLYRRAEAEGLTVRGIPLTNTWHEKGLRFADPAFEDAAARDEILYRARWGA